MDIYSFLNSKDIAEHCRSLQKTWTPLQMALIWSQRLRLSIRETKICVLQAR